MARAILITAAFSFALVAAPADARSNAANYLIDQEIAEACGGKGGHIDSRARSDRELELIEVRLPRNDINYGWREQVADFQRIAREAFGLPD